MPSTITCDEISSIDSSVELGVLLPPENIIHARTSLKITTILSKYSANAYFKNISKLGEYEPVRGLFSLLMVSGRNRINEDGVFMFRAEGNDCILLVTELLNYLSTDFRTKDKR